MTNDMCDGGTRYQQHPETGMVQRVHADGSNHAPSFNTQCMPQPIYCSSQTADLRAPTEPGCDEL